MMPSRGVLAARSGAPRLFQLQCRNLSSASRRIPQSPIRNAPSSISIKQRGQTPIPPLSATAIGIRHASSTPTTSPSAATTSSQSEAASSAAAASEPSSFPNLDTITLDNIDLSTTGDISAIPEKIGYLHEIGLNYGYGITSSLQWVLEHIHIYGGLPWWGSIAATAVLIRLAMLPLFLKSSDSMARQTALASVTKPITDKMSAAQREKDNAAVMAAWQELSAIRKRAGISFTNQFLPMIAQGVVGFCGFRLIRAMAALPVPALLNDGPLWLRDLTISDPYLTLPIVMGVAMHLIVRFGGETGAQSQMAEGMMRFMKYGMPAMIVLIMGWQPAALCVWFASTSAIGVTQGLLLQRPAVRNFFGIAPLYKPGKNDPTYESPFQAFMQSQTGGTSSSKGRPAGRTIDVGSGKNSAYMSPTYQSPNLRRSNTSQAFKKSDVQSSPAPNTISVPNNADADPDMQQPNKPARPASRGGVFSKASEAWRGVHDKGKNLADRFSNVTEEKKAERKKADFKKAADAYEKRARERMGKK